MYGYMGNVLRVNLTQGTTKLEALNEKDAKDYIGSRGLGVKTYMDEVDTTVKALSEENKVMIATGPLTGTFAPTGGRYMVITKSPLTERIGIANSGGYFGTQLKKAGIDMVIIEGKAQKPMYLLIEEDRIELRDAGHLWGKVLSETTKILEEETSSKHKILAIGPAGENLSPMGAVMNDIDRAAGRGGLGAVLGFKNLKAIVARGDKEVPLPDKAGYLKTVKEKVEKLKNDPVGGEGLPLYGTAVLVNIINEHGIHPSKNFQEGYTDPDTIDKVSGETLAKDYLTRKTHCASCPIGCGREVKLDDGRIVGGPEYETLWSFGADCYNFDLNNINEANELCNEYGLDTISAGATIAAAMEMYDKGYITDKDIEADGISLKWGDADSILKWLHKTGRNEGFGAKMAEGSYRLCESFGHPELSMSVKKQEIAAYDPRGAKGIGLNYATSNRGGCHIKGYMINAEILGYPVKMDRFTEDEEKVAMTILFQDLTALVDAMGICIFTTFGLKDVQDYVDLMNGCCGTDHTIESLLEAGSRIWQLERIYNLDNGLTRAEDTLPDRLVKEALPDGPSADEMIGLDAMITEYYRQRGWDASGELLAETADKFGISDYLN